MGPQRSGIYRRIGLFAPFGHFARVKRHSPQVSREGVDRQGQLLQCHRGCICLCDLLLKMCCQQGHLPGTVAQWTSVSFDQLKTPLNQSALLDNP